MLLPVNKSRTTCKGYEFIPQLSVRITADNYDQYLDEFSKALPSAVRMLLGEVGKLHEERRSIWLVLLIGPTYRLYLRCIDREHGRRPSVGLQELEKHAAVRVYFGSPMISYLPGCVWRMYRFFWPTLL